MKNAIDWLSRGRNSLDGKVAALFGASNGLFGTARGQIAVRQTLGALNVLVLPQPLVYIRLGEHAFRPDGSFQDSKTSDLLKALVERALRLAAQLKANPAV